MDKYYIPIEEVNIEENIEAARLKAEEFLKLHKEYCQKMKPAEHGWFIMRVEKSGINEKLYYTFYKVFDKLIPVTFKDKYRNEQQGFAYAIKYDTGFKFPRQKDIHQYGLAFDCVTTQTDGFFMKTQFQTSNYIKSCSKEFFKKFQKEGIDLKNLPDANNETLYPKE